MTEVAIYVRQSFDRTGEGAGVARQEQMCRDYATGKGWTVAEVLSDNDTSATTGVARPGFTRLLRGLGDGTYDGLVVYHADRLYRSLRDLVPLLDLHKVRPFVMGTVSGEIDLGTDQGRLMASILASVGAAEVERKNQRAKDANRSRALAGKTLSKFRVFGWEADNVTLRPSEASEIVSAYAGLIDGSTTLNKLARRWTDLGLRTHATKSTRGGSASGVWTAVGVRDVMTRERNCGRSVYQGAVVGTGEWEPIVSEADYDLLQSIFKSRQLPRNGHRVNGISGVPRCGRCGSVMYLNTVNQRRLYLCHPSSHLGIMRDKLEEAVEEWLKYELSDLNSRTVQTLNVTGTISRIRSVRAELGTLSDEETELGLSDIPFNVLKARASRLAAQRSQLEGELSSLLAGDRVVSLVTGLTPLSTYKGIKATRASEVFALHEEVLTRWRALSAPDQFAVLSAIAEIVVMPGRANNRVRISNKLAVPA